MSFTLLRFTDGRPMPARFDEFLMQRALQSGPSACLWQSGQGLVVPRTYQRLPRFAEACRRFARLGWPVTMRQSGGGLVPQGPGILNLSLAYAAEGLPLSRSDAAYQCLCGIIADALSEYGLVTQAQAVSGSFCDGRYNLAWVDANGAARKVAGTAQLWRRLDPDDATTAPVQVVLVHALLLAAIDTNTVTRVANGFERAAGGERRYDPGRIASLHAILAERTGTPDAITHSFTEHTRTDAIAHDPAVHTQHNAFVDDLADKLARRIQQTAPPDGATPRTNGTPTHL
jgi:lipoate-protein ligase A